MRKEAAITQQSHRANRPWLMLTEHPRAEDADGLSIMALTGGDVFRGEIFLSIIRKRIIRVFVFFFLSPVRGGKQDSLEKRCRRCKEEDTGIYLAQAQACL